MLRILFLKEYIKTRWFILAAALTLSGFSLYMMMNLYRIVNLKGAMHIWEVILQKDALFIDLIQWLPVIFGILLGLFQYAPEMHRKCLKLTLHLPVSYTKLGMLMVGYGVAALTGVFLLSFIILWTMMSRVLMPEMVSNILSHSLVWYLAGILSYLFTAWITIEPTWKRRLINIIVSVFMLKIFFISNVAGSYYAFMPILALYTIAASTLSILSISRFKTGVQD